MTDQPITVDANGPVSSRIASVRSWPPYRTYLIALLLLFVAKQAFTVVIFPPFTGHDEVVHYAYIRTVADEHRVPVIPDLEEWRIAWAERDEPPGDYIPNDLYTYQRYVLDWCCNPDSNPQYAKTPPGGMNLGGEIFPNGWQYAANHPPLYYLLMAPIYSATDWASPVAQQYVIRAAAIPIGVAIILLTYLIAGLIFPRDRFMLAVAPTFVAFQTQLSYESAMVNNDILLVAMFTLLVYLLVRGVMKSFTPGSAAVIGLVLGLGLLTKASMLSAAPLVAFAMILGIGITQVKRWVTLGAISGLVAGLVAFPWYLFLYRTYGNLTALEQVKALQYSWTYRGRTPPSIPDLLFNADFAKWRWRETWGEFGWRLIHVEGWLLLVIGIPLLIMTLTGLGMLVVHTIRRLRRSETVAALARNQVIALWLLVLVGVVAYFAMLQFGTTFQLTQARYFFNAVGAVAVIIAFGYRQALPVRFRPAGVVAFLVFMVGINVMIYSQYVLPYWYLAS